MPDKPDLFSKLFRSTKNNLKKQQKENKPRPKNRQSLGGSPKEKLDKKSSPAKIKIPLSGGKVDLYQTCPRKFYYSHIKKIRINSAPGAHLCFDQSLHKALTDFYRDKNKNEPFKLEKLGQFLARNWDNRGYKDKQQELEFKNIAVVAMKNYFEKYCKKPPRHIETDYFFKVDLFGCEYSGKIDRVDKLADGSIELIDYKSGKLPRGGSIELENSLNVQLLFHAADRIWPGKVKKITFIYLKENESISVYKNPGEMSISEKKFLNICEQIYQGNFEPIRSSACNYCDYKDSCPVGQIPDLNATRLKTYLDCPRKYAAYYIERIPRTFDKDQTVDLAIDRPIHDALAAFHNDYRPSPNLSPESFLFSRFYKEIPEDISEGMSEVVKNLGREILQNYLQKLFPKSNTKFVNKFIEYNQENFYFQTSIDRIDEDKEGNLILIDYKTGQRIKSANELKNDPVIAAIAAAASAVLPGKVISFSFIYLRHTEQVNIEVDEMLIQKGNQILEATGTKIREKSFEPLGGPTCANCAAAESCDSRRIPVSMSKIQTMRDCPKRYKFKYIDKAEVPETEKPALVLYQTLQAVLQASASSGKLESPEKLLEQAKEMILLSDQLSKESKEQVLEKAYTAFSNYNQIFKAGLPKIKSLAEQARIPYENLILTTRFDRIDVLPNQNYHVIIYKTGKKAMTPHEARLDVSGVYNWFIADRIYPNKVEKLSYVYLLTGDVIPFTPTDQDVEKLKLTLDEFYTANFADEFEGERNPLCPYCDYVDICQDAKSMLLSPSKINCFQSCPLKYKLKYIERVPKESRPTPNLSFDRSIHFALRDFHENYNKKQFKKNPFRRILNKYWITEGYSDIEEEERFKVRANIFLEEYFNSLDGNENPVAFEVSARWNWNDIDTVVQIDRIDKLPNGKLEIIDYKTGKKVPDERVLNEDTSLINMFLAANQKWPGKIDKVSYHYLSNNKRYSLTPSDEDIKSHKLKITDLVQQINKNEFEPNKGALCAWCEFYGPCPEWKVKPHEMAGETQEEFRKRIRLSYSKMSLYLNCPRSYRKLYIDKVPPKPQPFFSFGTTIHETFERVYDPLNPIEKPTLEEVLQMYDEVRLTHREGFASDEIEEQYRQDGINQITMYYNRFIKDCEFKPAYSIEDYFEIPCGKYAVMTGFIDRIDKLEDGTYEILDYKTEPTMRSQEAVDNDKQLSIYYWACEDTLGLKISKLSLLMLDHDCKIETTRTRDDIPKVIESVDKTAYQMIHETEFKPTKNKYCKSCDHLHDCPLKDEILADESLISMKKF